MPQSVGYGEAEILRVGIRPEEACGLIMVAAARGQMMAAFGGRAEKICSIWGLRLLTIASVDGPLLL